MMPQGNGNKMMNYLKGENVKFDLVLAKVIIIIWILFHFNEKIFDAI